MDMSLAMCVRISTTDQPTIGVQVSVELGRNEVPVLLHIAARVQPRRHEASWCDLLEEVPDVVELSASGHNDGCGPFGANLRWEAEQNALQRETLCCTLRCGLRVITAVPGWDTLPRENLPKAILSVTQPWISPA